VRALAGDIQLSAACLAAIALSLFLDPKSMTQAAGKN